MSYELVSNVGFKKSDGKITVSSYCNNVWPKKTRTFEYAGDLAFDEKLECLIKDVIGNNLKLLSSCDCVFSRAYAFALKDIAKEEGLSLKEFYDDIMKVVWYLEDFDDPKFAPSNKTYERFKRVCEKTKYYMYNKNKINDDFVAYNYKESQRILHYSIYGR